MIFRFLRDRALGKSDRLPVQEGQPQDYKGFTIQPAPQKEGGGWRIRGLISKQVGGERRIHTLIRADTYPDVETAMDMTVAKAKRVIDEQGERLFEEDRGEAGG